nr:unnamed protein product [Digitaria exilis]
MNLAVDSSPDAHLLPAGSSYCAAESILAAVARRSGQTTATHRPAPNQGAARRWPRREQGSSRPPPPLLGGRAPAREVGSPVFLFDRGKRATARGKEEREE